MKLDNTTKRSNTAGDESEREGIDLNASENEEDEDEDLNSPQKEQALELKMGSHPKNEFTENDST